MIERFKLSIKHRKKTSKAHKGMVGKHHSEKTKEKMSKSRLGMYKGEKHPLYGKHFYHSKEWNQNIGLGNKGKKRSEEQKQKMSEITLGKYKGENNPMYGKTFSEEHKKKISESLKGRSVWNKGVVGYNTKRKGYKHSEETKRLIKEKRKNQITPRIDTSIELKIQNFLKQLDIEFFTHQYMHIEHGYQCDILIPSKNMVIECDGTYWHKYPIGKEIDHIRTSELIQKGFKVLRLWEFEINEMTLNKFKERIE